jgi:uncharacterized protein (DUF433 family)
LFQKIKIRTIFQKNPYLCSTNLLKNKKMNRITIKPDICFGKPCIRGLRYPVEMILDLLAAGMTTDEILDDYPDLVREDISACLQFASRMMQVKSVHQLIAA